MKVTRILGSLLVLSLLVTTVSAASFPDVEDSAPYAKAVEYVNEIGIMQGKNGGVFDPEGSVTRAEMAAIICRMLGFDVDGLSGKSSFSDCQGHWAEKYIAKVAESGIVTGYGNGNFGPGDTVTYEQAMTMLVRTAGHESQAKSLGGYPDGYLTVAEYTGMLEGILSGKGRPFSRGEVAQAIYNSTDREVSTRNYTNDDVADLLCNHKWLIQFPAGEGYVTFSKDGSCVIQFTSSSKIEHSSWTYENNVLNMYGKKLDYCSESEFTNGEVYLTVRQTD